MYRDHNERVLSQYPGDPEVEDHCDCHCHHPVGSCQECDCCLYNEHDPDLCHDPGDPPHTERGGVCPCTQTDEEARAQYEAEMAFERGIGHDDCRD